MPQQQLLFLFFSAAAGFAILVLILYLLFARQRTINALGAELGGRNLELDATRVEHATLQADFAAVSADLRNLRQILDGAAEEARRQTQKNEQTTAERDALHRRVTQNDAEAKALEARLADLREAKDQMRQEFNEIAGKLLKSNGAVFMEQNKQQIDSLLSPLKTKIQEFEKGVATSHHESVKQHAALKEQITILSQQSAQMSKGTEDLTRALKGKVQTQGAWGEMVLETILQRSGLREGEEYTRQDSHVHDDGRRIRTDVIINLPNGEYLVIDAKVSLKDYEGFINAESDVEKSARLAAHAASVKNHIKTLAGKEYHAAAGGKLDFVIMFMPIEAALGAALQHDGEIGFFAAENKVAISTPTTLTIALKTVAAIWRVERQNKNAAEIAQRAGRLYDKFVGFLTDVDAIGERIGQLHRTYDDAVKKLSTGRGNLVSQVEHLKEMGAETNKAIDPKLLDNDPPLLTRAAS